MLLMDVEGTTSECALRGVFGENESVQLIPYSVLGDLTLKVRLARDTPRRLEIEQALERLRLRVLAYRWVS